MCGGTPKSTLGLPLAAKAHAASLGLGGACARFITSASNQGGFESSLGKIIGEHRDTHESAWIVSDWFSKGPGGWGGFESKGPGGGVASKIVRK